MLWSCSQCLLTFHYPIWLLQGRVSWQSHLAKAGQPLWSSCRSSTTLPSLLYIRRKPVLFTGLVIGVFTEKWPQHCQITILPYEHTHLVFLLGGSYSLILHTLGKKGNDYTHVYCSSCYQTPVPILIRAPCGGHVFLTLVWVLIPLLSHRQSYLHITFLGLHSYNCLNSPLSPTSPPHYSSVPLLYRCHHPQLFTTSSASITLAYAFSVSSVHSSVPTGSLTWAMSKSPPSKQWLDSALGWSTNPKHQPHLSLYH